MKSNSELSQASQPLSYKINYSELSFGRRLGVGGFGEVFQGTWQHNDVAIKRLHMHALSSEAEEELKREAEIMSQIRFPQVVNFYGLSLDQSPYCLVMELMPKGSLYHVLHNAREELPWSLRYRIAVDVAVGLSHLHYRGIIHRDLKSLNILLDDRMRARISDFGLSKLKNETKTTTKNNASSAQGGQVGSVLWMAPELFKRGGGQHTKYSDIYSLAMILWEIASRKNPWEEAQDNSIVINWVSQGERETIPSDCPAEFSQVITKAWQTDAKERPSADQIALQLKALYSALSGSKSEGPELKKQEEKIIDNKGSEQKNSGLNDSGFSQNDSAPNSSLNYAANQSQGVQSGEKQSEVQYANNLQSDLKSSESADRKNDSQISYVGNQNSSMQQSGIQYANNLRTEIKSAEVKNSVPSVSLVPASIPSSDTKEIKEDKCDFSFLMSLGDCKTTRDELVWAAHLGDLPKINALLSAGVNVNGEVKDEGYSPLVAAVWTCNRPEAFELLLSRGASLSVKCGNRNILEMMIFENKWSLQKRLESVEDLLKRGLKFAYPELQWAFYGNLTQLQRKYPGVVAANQIPKIEDNNGHSILHYAAHNGHLAIVQWLLTSGVASVAEKNKESGWTALLLAAQQGHLSVVQWLLTLGGASIAEKTNDGKTALLWAAQQGHLAVVQWLLTSGRASIKERSIESVDGKTALLLAASHGHLAVVQWLLASGGAAITEKSKSGYGGNDNYTALLCAAQNGHLTVMQWLLTSGGASIREKACCDDSALLVAARGGQLNVVQWLLTPAGGASIKEKNSIGQTALLLAAYGGHLSVVQWLLKAGGASIREKNIRDETALLSAARGGHLSVVQWLLTSGGASIAEKDNDGTTALLKAAQSGCIGVIQWLLTQGGASIAEKDLSGRTALLYASWHSHLSLIQWLLTSGGASITEKDPSGKTALLFSAYQGHLAGVQWLLTSGYASIAEKDPSGRTALLLAALDGHLSVVQWLLTSGGSSIAEKDNNGTTALLNAAYTGRLSLVQWLLTSGGASIAEKNKEGQTALDLAKTLNHIEVVEFLKKFSTHKSLPQVSVLRNNESKRSQAAQQTPATQPSKTSFMKRFFG